MENTRFTNSAMTEAGEELQSRNNKEQLAVEDIPVKKQEKRSSSDVLISIPHLDNDKGVMDVLQNTQNDNHGEENRGPPIFSRLISKVRNSCSIRKCETLILAYQTMGVVYGGISTSSLYVFSTIQLEAPTEKDYLGIMSIIFWTLTLVGLIKYGFIVLQADDHGEGGTFALYSLLCQYANISGKKHQPTKYITRAASKEALIKRSLAPKSRLTKFLERSKHAQNLVFCVTMLGTCMLIGDGILTPAISVLSAIAGLKTASNSLSQTVIVLISAALLVALFLCQRFGTKRVSFIFSPVIMVWLISTPLVGTYNIVLHYPAIFKAISPHHLVAFFLRRREDGWRALAGTVLCITSAEAMFADLGHFNRRSMQVAFAFVVYPSCVLTYAGQAAYLIKHPEDSAQVFYKFIPTAVFWPMFVISTLAAIVASQALISACFSLIKQSVALDYFPKVKLIHTSETHEGQVYSPEVNYFLMVLCVAVVLGFRDTSSLGNAYGVAVIMVMLITTCLLSVVMVVVWDAPRLLVVVFFGTFATIEGIYVSAVLSKVPQGGWLPFLVATFLAVIMFSWVYGRYKQNEYEKANTISIDDLGCLLSTSNIKRVPGLCFFYCDLSDDVPPLIRHYLKNVRSLHQVIVLTSLRYAKVPKIPETQRFTFSRCGGYKGLYRCVALYGYAESKDSEWSSFWETLAESLKDFIQASTSQASSPRDGRSIQKSSATQGGDGSQLQDGFAEDLAEIESAKKEGPVFVLGRTRVVSKRSGLRSWFGKVILDNIYHFLYSNSTSSASSLTVPAASLMEISLLYEV